MYQNLQSLLDDTTIARICDEPIQCNYARL